MSSCITIYTDASVHDESQTGGWACWIKSAPGETALYSGAFKTAVKSTTDAELMAVANGIAAAKKIARPTDIIFVVVTDCAAVIQYIEYARSRQTHREGFKQKRLLETPFKLAKHILSLVPESCELRVNKVKAHNGKKDGARSYVNNLVDKACRQAMREARGKRVSA